MNNNNNNMNNYTTGFIYKIVDDDNKDFFYIGSTCKTLQERFKQHKYDYNKYLNYKRPFQTSFLLMQKNYQSILLIETLNFFNKIELLERERFHIINNNCVNKNVPNNFLIFQNKKLYSKKYDYTNNRNQIFICLCGGSYNVKNKDRHFNTKKHINFFISN